LANSAAPAIQNVKNATFQKITAQILFRFAERVGEFLAETSKVMH
jgi:hypothetical protein